MDESNTFGSVVVSGVGVSGCKEVMVVSFTIIVGTLNLDFS